MKTLHVPDTCSDLSIIRAEDAGCFQTAINQCEIKSHHYYFPRLLFSGQRKDRLLLFEMVEDSVLVYNLQQRTSRMALNLYLPPFPFSAAALKKAMERLKDFNHGRPGHVDWVQESDADLVAQHGFAISLREKEFIYDSAAVAEMKGPEFARLRRYLASMKKYEGLVVREFTSADEEACMALYRKFRGQLQAKGVEPKGYNAMVNCLKGATRLPASRLRGEVFEIGGTVHAYSFGGPIDSTYGCVFLTVADHDFPGLAYALRHQMMMNFPELAYFNDTTDNNRSGLREMKQRFRPVEMHNIFGARERE